MYILFLKNYIRFVIRTDEALYKNGGHRNRSGGILLIMGPVSIRSELCSREWVHFPLASLFFHS